MSRIVIVSNRLPLTIDKKEGALHYYPSAGGLATGLNSLDEQIEKIWIGWPGRAVKSSTEQEEIKKELVDRQLFPVFLNKKEIERYYEGFSNKTIWPHFHYFTQYTTYDNQYWKYYQSVNQRFAEAVIEQLKEDDIVWIHDYQLLLLPALIRQKFPTISIGFFLHIPFPSYEIFRMLPWRKEILEGVLGADLIGFHTYGYMRHFLSAVYRIAGYEHNFGRLTINNRLVNTDVFPMGINYEKYAFPPNVESSLFQQNEDQKLIISIDRLDYTKGIPQRLRAFEQFIQRYPSYRGKATLMLIVVPSRSNVDQYQDLKNEVNTLVGRINGEYGTFDWVPIQYYYRSFSFEDLVAIYQAADIAMITPLRDGMNLVAKEYVASKEKSQKGVLILSEMAGASSELSDALTVNPQDENDIVEKLYLALTMPNQEQAERLQKMQKRLKKFTVSHWAEAFIHELLDLQEGRKKVYTSFLGSKHQYQLLDKYKKAKHALLILDYDGTLMNFHKDINAVSPDEELMSMLTQLTNRSQNKLVINSGRDHTTLDQWVGHLGIDLAAEHGVWLKKGDIWQVNAGMSSNWKKTVRPVLESLVERSPGSFVEEKNHSLAWHYRSIDRDLGAKRVREFRDVLIYLTANLDLQVLEGNKVVEIKNAGVNKGKACLQWLAEKDYDFILAIGDDQTDEDTFKALPDEAFTIKVGDEQTAARFNVQSVAQVRELLRLLCNS